MFETPQPPPAPDRLEAGIPTDDLLDPIAGVLAVELSRRFVELCMCRADSTVAELAHQEVMLVKPGGIGLAAQLLAHRFYHRMHGVVFDLLRNSVPLEHAGSAMSRVEELLRAAFSEVIRTAADYLLSDDRDTAIQMMTVATTMAAREVRAGFAEIVIATRRVEE